MSGIDQQIIHYIHPLAVIVILVMISLLARRSRRFSSIISHGIIHVICCLLLLSYTSVASTSLLLMRPLKFNGIDEVYAYLSPDIEYFHDRHLAYGIVALLCTVSIVIGLPLLLTLEPFSKSQNQLHQNQTISGPVSRLLQRQVSLLCWLLYELSTSNHLNCHC